MPARKTRNGSGGETVEILRAIWKEMKALNLRVDGTNERLEAVRTDLSARIDQVRTDPSARIDQTNVRLEEVRGELKRGMAESEVCLATATTELAGDVRDLTDQIREWRAEHRADRSAMAERVARLEAWRREVEHQGPSR